MKTYKHSVQYYETDRMGITHHYNYVRWMEEARSFLLRDIGFPYDCIESKGIISPVTAVDCRYKATSTFADEITIFIEVASVKGARLALDYTMTNQDQILVCQGHSEHSFLNRDGNFVLLKRDFPNFYQALKELENKNAF